MDWLSGDADQGGCQTKKPRRKSRGFGKGSAGSTLADVASTDESLADRRARKQYRQFVEAHISPYCGVPISSEIRRFFDLHCCCRTAS